LLITVSVAVCDAMGGVSAEYVTVAKHFFPGPSATPSQVFAEIANGEVVGIFVKLTVSAVVDLPPVFVSVTVEDEPDVEPGVSTMGLVAFDCRLADKTGPAAPAPPTAARTYATAAKTAAVSRTG
jgi:hypothetical protein